MEGSLTPMNNNHLPLLAGEVLEIPKPVSHGTSWVRIYLDASALLAIVLIAVIITA